MLTGMQYQMMYTNSSSIETQHPRSENHGVLSVRGDNFVCGSAPSTSRYLNFNRQDFRLYLGMSLSVIIFCKH